MGDPKTVLVIVGENRKPITFESSGGQDSLKRAIKAKFDKVGSDFMLQVKSSEWNGLFVDIEEGDVIENKSVINVVNKVSTVVSINNTSFIIII